MLPCDTCQSLLLDHLYGLLDSDEAQAVETHLTGCPACQAARDKAAHLQGMLAQAAKSAFPEVKFTPPVEPATPVVAPSTPVTVTTPVSTPADRRTTVTQVWVRWVVAAGLLLAFTGLGGPATRDLIGYYAYKPAVVRQMPMLRDARDQVDALSTEIATTRAELDTHLATATATHDRIVTEWVKAEETARAQVAARPFVVDIRGPASAIPGAPNDYTFTVADKQGRPADTTVTAEVRDTTGKVYFRQKFETKRDSKPTTLRLPAEIWAAAPPTANLSLQVSTTDPKTGTRTALTEDLHLQEAVYTTFLSTDKPMYQPGETVYFRTTTLDRTRFLPPESDLNLRFVLTAPSGAPVPGLELVGLAKPVRPDGSLILGPDQKPVRGVGTGAFSLPEGLAGGEYTLTVTELPINAFQPVAHTAPLAVRKFLVNRYTPDRLLKKLEFDAKTYGPGDTVQAKFDVADQGTPLANAALSITADADGQPLQLAIAPTQTSTNGTAAIRFTLPNAEAITEARLNVTVSQGGIVETITRRVPLATRKLTVEFFPEGGDLLAGLPNRVYFRATTATGKPADIEGVLTDGVRDIAKFKTLTDAEQPGVNQGLGAFTFTPEAGKQYAVRLMKPVGIVQPLLAPLNPQTAGVLGVAALPRGYALPAVRKDGVSLHVLDTVSVPGSPIRVRLASAGAKREVVVGAYIRSQPVAQSRATLEPGKPVDLVLDPGSTRIGGVTRITVFEEPAEADGREDLKPVAERLVYRNPGEVLKLAASLKKANGMPTSSFVPGETVKLEVTATTEASAPTPAILWASVVNKSVLTMADEKTARLMPTHFLLGGEVQNPAELEHADFLLTDHPKAAESLDLLLGTQGWRRFAEQAPGQFRQRVPAEDADRLLVAMGANGPVPTSWRGGVRRVFDNYWPQYEAASLDLDTAQRNHTEQTTVRALTQELTSAQSVYSGRLSAFGQAAYDLEIYTNSLAERRFWLPATVGLLLLVAVLLIVLRSLRPTGTAGSRSLVAGAVGLILLAAFLGLTVAVTSFGNQGWQAFAAIAPKPERDTDSRWNMVATAVPPMAAAQPEMMVDKAEEKAAIAADAFAPAMPGAAMMPGGAAPEVARFGRPQAAPPGMAFRPAPAAPRMMMKAMPQAMPEAVPGNLQGMDRREQDRANQGAVNGKKRFARNFRMDGQLRGREFGRPFPGERAQIAMQNPAAARLADAFRKTIEKQQFGAGPGAGAKAEAVPFDEIQRIERAIPNSPPLLVREYAHTRPTPTPEANGTRTDFTETLLWQPVLVTPSDGRLTLEFALADAVAPYQVLIAGHTLDGRIGAMTSLIEVRKPFALDPKLPKEISSSDKLDVPVMLTNATDNPLFAQYTVQANGLKLEGPAERTRTLEPHHGNRSIVRLTPTQLEGELAVTVTGTAGFGTDDSIRRTLTVVPDGFPYQGSFAATLEQMARANVTLPADRVAGTTKVTVTLYPNTLSELQAGLDGLLREPYGCFEQSSTTNYPNVLISQYLEETNQAQPEISRRAKELMDRGYARLIGYECPKTGFDGRTGFEWFGGKDQQHEALTAYGLLQFTDMSKVYAVDTAMLQRTKAYLLACRNGKGGFTRNPRALDSFGGAPDHITNAFIVWAITESEKGATEQSDLSQELDALTTAAQAGPAAQDPYFLALVANALLNRGRSADANVMLKTIVTRQAQDGSIPGATTSITRSGGRDLLIETTALATLGFLKANRNDLFHNAARSAIAWITRQRGGHGGFGSTQSTILALKALIEQARLSKRPAESGELEIRVAGVRVGTKPFTTDSTGPIVYEIPAPDTRFGGEPVEVEVRTTAKQAYPVTVAWECRTRKPNSSPECPIQLSTVWDKPACPEGDMVRLGLTIENLAKNSQGMTVAIVGLPAGLKLPEDMKQLKALTEQPKDGSEPTLSFWETRGRELILYWRGMKPNQKVSFGIDLIADVPGEYTGPASRAYLYYNADHKHWVAPATVVIPARQ